VRVSIQDAPKTRTDRRPRSVIPTAILVVAVAVLVSGPMAFGIAMSSDSYPNWQNPYLYGLAGLLTVAVGALVGSVVSARRAANGVPNSVAGWLAGAALVSGGLIVFAFAAEVLSVAAGF
jgi:hypothetical protein